MNPLSLAVCLIFIKRHMALATTPEKKSYCVSRKRHSMREHSHNSIKRLFERSIVFARKFESGYIHPQLASAAGSYLLDVHPLQDKTLLLVDRLNAIDTKLPVTDCELLLQNPFSGVEVYIDHSPIFKVSKSTSNVDLNRSTQLRQSLDDVVSHYSVCTSESKGRLQKSIKTIFAMWCDEVRQVLLLERVIWSVEAERFLLFQPQRLPELLTHLLDFRSDSRAAFIKVPTQGELLNHEEH